MIFSRQTLRAEWVSMRGPTWTLIRQHITFSAFSLAATSIISAKLLRLYAHRAAIASPLLVLWIPSFFLQDTIALLLLRCCQHAGRFGPGLVTCAAWILCFMATVDISFFFTSGSELQWRNISVAEDPASWTMLSTGLFAAAGVFLGLLALSILLRTPCMAVNDAILGWLSSFGLKCVAVAKAVYQRNPTKHDGYQAVPFADLEGAAAAMASHMPSEKESPWASRLATLQTVGEYLALVWLMIQLVCTVFRPKNETSTFVSWTLPLQPIQFLVSLTFDWAVYNGLGSIPMNITALTSPVLLTGLPTELPSGFDDWYEKSNHYNATQDPLKISNLGNGLIPQLQDLDLSDHPVQHVILLTLESTRKDVFPLKKDGIIWDKLAATAPNETVLRDLHEKLASLTPIARSLTGDYNDGFHESNGKRQSAPADRGGLNINTAFTTSSYTLKSLTGTHCGITPIAADFNMEHSHHIYQPCLPQILDMLNDLECAPKNGNTKGGEKWNSYYMQSTTLGYDNQDKLMPKLGFADDHIIGKDYLKSSGHKFNASQLEDVNYYGLPEVALEDYLRDTFATAKEKNERVFWSHLTSSSHDPFGIPKSREILDLGPKHLISRYLNAIHYDDWWLGRIMEILEQEGVLNQTLIVAVGDHGLSVVEHGSITPYENPHVANIHVPLVFSHPSLPRTIDINEPVSSIQILPTIPDILIETKSLSSCQIDTARELLANYEGQSLLRPLKNSTPDTGRGNWQFTVTNPGGSVLSMRDTRHPDWRLVVPLIANEEWWFSNFTRDPHDMSPIRSFDRNVLLDKVDVAGGDDAVRWINEATQVARWWTVENRRRWRYGKPPRGGGG